MATSSITSTINHLAETIRAQIKFKPRVAIILGTGLNCLTEFIQNSKIISYQELSGWPISTAPGHVGRLIAGFLEKQPVIVMQGRAHFYEGYSMEQITLPVRVMQQLGVEILIVTNAAGAINPDFAPGDVMLITDHLGLISMAGLNPLIGP
ncbi:MAG: purine-nucleoside phosphorylase, partial [Candidatus Falkowbacteria bacterium]|nr:purine-nucleoside phosphorylase [Candidatus Falkowbacteria bacterium]